MLVVYSYLFSVMRVGNCTNGDFYFLSYLNIC
nr:MAG TPA: hypothetical protein [Caudoviricetes sp.]